MKSLMDIAVELREENPRAGDYKAYADIPSESLTEGFLIAWITFGGELSSVPQAQRTELMKRIAVSYDALAFTHIAPEEVGDYASLAVDAVGFSALNAQHIKTEILTEDLVIRLITRNMAAMTYLKLDTINNHLLTDNVISRIVRTGLHQASWLKYCFKTMIDGRVRDEDLIAAIKNNCTQLHHLKEFNRLYLIEGLLKSGYWPGRRFKKYGLKQGSAVDVSAPPASPFEAMTRLDSLVSSGLILLHKESLKLFPLDQVISTTLEIPGINVILMEVYTVDELKPHVRLMNRELRGRILEGVLGL